MPGGDVNLERICKILLGEEPIVPEYIHGHGIDNDNDELIWFGIKQESEQSEVSLLSEAPEQIPLDVELLLGEASNDVYEKNFSLALDKYQAISFAIPQDSSLRNELTETIKKLKDIVKIKSIQNLTSALNKDHFSKIKNMDSHPEIDIPDNNSYLEADLDLQRFVQQEDMAAIHHLIRYIWANEIINQFPPKRVLDVECRVGDGSYLLAKNNPGIQILGIDSDEININNARALYRLPNLQFEQGDGTSLQFGDFEAIISFDTIQRIEHREIMLFNIISHLTERGYLLFSTPCGQPKTNLRPDFSQHKIEYSNDILLDLLSRYFYSILRPENGTLPALEIFDKINYDRIRYVLNMNPVLCRGPRRTN